MKKQELKRKIIALNVLVLAAMQCLFAQDIHFSQFLNAPLLVNPAHAGIFNGDYRAGINYKGQWSSVTNAYQTMAAAFDAPVFFKKQKSRRVNYLTAGITAYTDRAGTSKMSTTAVNGIVGYNLKISKYNNLSAAIQGGMVQRSISINKLKWDQQYDGNTYHPDASSGEFFSSRAFYFADIGAGFGVYLFRKKILGAIQEYRSGISHLRIIPFFPIIANDYIIKYNYTMKSCFVCRACPWSLFHKFGM